MKILPAVLCLFAAATVGAGEAIYQLVGGDAPVAAAANGFVQEVRAVTDAEVEVQVAATLGPIGATGTYAQVLAAGGASEVPAGFALPSRLKVRLRPDIGAWEAATLVLEWAADHVVLDTSDGGPQDASSVLRRGRGRCSGLANATTALLLTAGFEARTVSGLLVSDDGAIPHRWLECRLPGAGWVPADPTLGLWAITSRHIVFADTVTRPPAVRVVGGSGGLERLSRDGKRLLRPNRGADLVCRLSGAWQDPQPVAVLRGIGGDVRRARLDPEARFSGLLPGRWLLEVEAGGLVVERQELFLRSGEVHSYVVRQPEDAEVGS